MRSLSRDEAHLWYVFPEALTDPDLLLAYAALMAPEEAEQQMRFYFAEGRHEYLVTRALVRTVLSAYAPVRPQDWVFKKNEYGRPEISGPATSPDASPLPKLAFNLAHTRGLIVCLVALDREIGIDVEHTTRASDTDQILDRFSPLEAGTMRALSPEERRDRFFDYWTLKESYIKARGMGLAIPLAQFTFHLGGPHESPRISFDPALPDDASTWQFMLTSPTPEHRLAVAIRKGADAPLVITFEETVPLRV
jgi:4'-phosphopantetheinyl transferase